jgi:hypothetical protein
VLTAKETARKYDKMQDAIRSYAEGSGDGFGDLDYRGADEYREAGYCLAEDARGVRGMTAGERAEWIDSAVSTYPESARYLVAVSADFRLSELVARDDRFPFNADAPAHGVAL